MYIHSHMEKLHGLCLMTKDNKVIKNSPQRRQPSYLKDPCTCIYAVLDLQEDCVLLLLLFQGLTFNFFWCFVTNSRMV